MSDLAMWSLIVGFFMPIVIAIVQQPKFHSGARAVVTFLVCVIAGAGTAYFQGALTGQRFASSVLLVLVTAIATYKGLWQPTNVAPKIEEKTSPS